MKKDMLIKLLGLNLGIAAANIAVFSPGLLDVDLFGAGALEAAGPLGQLTQALGWGSGMTCWRRLRDWQAAGVWHRLHLLLLDELRGAGKLDFSRACMDGASVASPRGANTPAPTQRTGASLAASATSSRTAKASR